MHLAAGGSQCVAAARSSRGYMPLQAARGPDGFSSVEAYDKDRLHLDAQVSCCYCELWSLNLQQLSESSFVAAAGAQHHDQQSCCGVSS